MYMLEIIIHDIRIHQLIMKKLFLASNKKWGEIIGSLKREKE